MNGFKGFTLAEVLITLGIIGVVAALTVPTLIANNQKKTYVTQLKKVYTQFNEALKLMALDKGCGTDLACTGAFDSTTNNELAGKEFIKYFKVVKDCGIATKLGCMPQSVSDNYDGSGSIYSMDDWDYYKFITAEGASVGIYSFKSLCADNYSHSGTGPMSKFCGYVFFDVNGPNKGPDNLGRDIFSFNITNGAGALLYPTGGNEDNANGWWQDPSSPTCFSDEPYGGTCAGRIIEEGWQMNY